MDHGVVPARKAKPRGTTAARVAGATPLDLPPREMNPLRPVPTPTTGAVSQGPPTELTLCQYTERQDAKKCNNLSKFECPLHRPGDGVLCDCGFRFCGSHAEHIEYLGLHEGQRRSGAPPPEVVHADRLQEPVKAVNLGADGEGAAAALAYTAVARLGGAKAYPSADREGMGA